MNSRVFRLRNDTILLIRESVIYYQYSLENQSEHQVKGCEVYKRTINKIESLNDILEQIDVL